MAEGTRSVTDEVKPAPYPADTRAKGWRFELDYERIEQSDTWAMAEEVPMAQHALVFMWLMAWRQEPCGSLPNDEAVIRSKCRIPMKSWASLRDVLMRGWWLADDGRLYHPTIVKRVLEMLEYRRKTADRVAKHKAAKRIERFGNTLPTQADSVKNDTGTGTGTEDKTEDFNGSRGAGAGGAPGPTLADPDDSPWGDDPPLPSAPPPGAEDGVGLPMPAGTVYGSIAKVLRERGIQANPGHPSFRALVDAGADALEFLAFSDKAKTQRDPFAYLLRCVEVERERAKDMAGKLHQGRMPAAASPAASKADALMASNIAAAQRFLAKDQHGA